jgi:hypothetical protein
MNKLRYLLLLLAVQSVSATELYNLDFTPPDVGTYETVFGNPSVQSSVGPFTDALIFHAVTGYDQIELPIEISSPQYEIQFDVLTHNLLNSQYSFSVLLDTPEVRDVSFNGGLNSISVFQPFRESNVGSFLNDQVYHLDISVDLLANLWTVSIDGTQVSSNPINANELDSIRFSMSPWTVGASNAPGTYAALDNVVIDAVPEPSCIALILLATLICTVMYARKAKQFAQAANT